MLQLIATQTPATVSAVASMYASFVMLLNTVSSCESQKQLLLLTSSSQQTTTTPPMLISYQKTPEVHVQTGAALIDRWTSENHLRHLLTCGIKV